MNDQFARGEVCSTQAYPQDFKVKGVAQQIKIIHEVFSEVKWGYFRPNEDQIVVPSEAEGLFAIPRWDKIASTYNEAVEKVLVRIIEACKFLNPREPIFPKNLRQHERTVAMLKSLGDQQKDFDILVFPAQFGFRHMGRSVHLACQMMSSSEFGLGAFAVASMILTHPERLQHDDGFWIDCPGDECDIPSDDHRSRGAPSFNFFAGRLGFGATWDGHAHDRSGSVSGFIP